MTPLELARTLAELDAQATPGPEGIHNRRAFYTRHRLDEWDLLAMTIERLNERHA